MKIKNKKTFIYITVSLIMVVGVILTSLLEMIKIQQQAVEEINSIVQLKAKEIEGWRRARLIDAKVLSDNMFLNSAMVYWLKTQDAKTKSKLKESLESLKNNYSYHDIMVVCTGGIIRLSLLSDEMHQLDEQGLMALADSWDSGNPTFSDTYDIQEENDSFLRIFVPLFDKGIEIGGAALEIDSDVVSINFLKDWPVDKVHGIFRLIKKGRSDFSYLDQKEGSSEWAWKEVSNDPLLRLIDFTKNPTGDQHVGDDSDSIISIYPVADSPWYLSAQINKSDYYQSAMSEVWLQVLVIFLGLGLVSLVIYLTWQSRERDQYKRSLADQKELTKAQERFRLIYEGSRDAIILFEPRSILDCNSSALTLFKDLDKEHFKDTGKASKSGPSLLALLNQSSSASNIPEVLFNKSDNSQFFGEVSVSTYDYEGTSFLQATIRDISVRKKNEESIRLLNDDLNVKLSELTKANSAKNDFLANMSHEIRTPMNAILGLAQLMIRDNPSPTQNIFLTNILESGKSLLHIINEVLDLSKIESGVFTIEKDTFSIVQLLERVFDLLSSKAKEKGLALSLSISDKLCPEYVGDFLRLEQVLINLIGNALKFTDTGTVAIEVELLDGSSDDHLVNFSVKDTGVGISNDVAEDIFKPFMQGDSTITRRFGGTGLGLSISKKLVDLMGGDIGFKSEVGVGSVFSFKIPLTRTCSVLPTVKTPISTDNDEQWLNATAATDVTVLVVDDNKTNLLLVKRALLIEGYRVDTAYNGAEAISALEASPAKYSLILMDVQMPVMDGLEATRKIRNSSLISGIPIIALTAGVLPTEKEMAVDAGVDDFISKPLNLEVLLSRISFHINRSAD